MALNARQRRFVEEYVIDLNATKAAVRAGYSERSAGKIGWELRQNPEIQAAIARAEEDHLEAIGVRARSVLEELVGTAYSDLGKVMRWSNAGVDFVPSEQLPDEVRRTVAGITVKRRRMTLPDPETGEFAEWELEELGVKLWDKLRALELIGKRMGMWTDKVEHAGEVGIREYVGIDVEMV